MIIFMVKKIIRLGYGHSIVFKNGIITTIINRFNQKK